MIKPATSRILILDFGSQYTKLIARRIREAKVYCEIHPYHFSLENIKEWKPDGIILTGSPASVFSQGAPLISTELFSLGPPILGICYGMQLTAHFFGGKVEATGVREYGDTEVEFDPHPLFGDLRSPAQVWMSHGDHITKVPAGFSVFARSRNCEIVAFAHESKPIVGVQFHPEVIHTPEGATILQNFLFKICQLKPDWTMGSFAEEALRKIREQVGNKRVICGLSGGVDSAVAAVLIHKAIGDRLTCIFVDNGLLRKNERQKVEQVFRKHFGIPLIVVEAEKRFLEKLEGVTNPEIKRKIIGKEFIAVFETEAHKIPDVAFLAQGTLYPDVIESVSFKGPSAVIKSHHNVGGLPEKMGLQLVEPLRELFKDEVRTLGRSLGMPEEVLGRQPFPGPGLAIRILGEVDSGRLAILRAADEVMMEEIKKAGWYDKLWQSFCVLLPVKTVGVMGDERTYENVIALRAVESLDGMTADWAPLPHTLLATISNRIINEVKGVNRVVFDISSKPPATIEWE